MHTLGVLSKTAHAASHRLPQQCSSIHDILPLPSVIFLPLPPLSFLSLSGALVRGPISPPAPHPHLPPQQCSSIRDILALPSLLPLPLLPSSPSSLS
ncbi:unnamed protein product, partial [Closterium sp. NIES-53]